MTVGSSQRMHPHERIRNSQHQAFKLLKVSSQARQPLAVLKSF